jgi:hypothetical protein
MTRSTLDIALLVVLTVGAVALLLKLFWPKAAHVPDASDNWAQHNEEAMPSVKGADGSTSLRDAIDMSIVDGDI